jgi:hypothetical protein
MTNQSQNNARANARQMDQDATLWGRVRELSRLRLYRSTACKPATTSTTPLQRGLRSRLILMGPYGSTKILPASALSNARTSRDASKSNLMDSSVGELLDIDVPSKWAYLWPSTASLQKLNGGDKRLG